MSNQQSRQDEQPETQQHDNQPELQQHDTQVVLPPHAHADDRLPRLIDLTIKLVDITRDLLTSHHSSASEEDWVHDLLTGDPQHIQTQLGVSRGTFAVLIKAIQTLGLQSSKHTPIEEQLSIFLYTMVTGLSCAHVAERFEWSPATILKCVLIMSFNCL